MTALDYNDLAREVEEFLAKNKLMVLATGAEGRITARMISTIHCGLKIYFQTDRDSVKGRQIAENPRVALCIGNLQIEGAARLTAHPYEHPYFKEHYARIHPGSFKSYSGLPSNVVVEVEPSLAAFWKYGAAGRPYRDVLDVAQREAYREHVQTAK